MAAPLPAAARDPRRLRRYRRRRGLRLLDDRVELVMLAVGDGLIMARAR
jgi:hypothetical protein